ncbi:MAG TPA: nucleotidyltransferase family protein [Casimicrobiaceae bacterium]|nr:nucleotidyltransferase family protein [Casimicrobiaceae bacterium]
MAVMREVLIDALRDPSRVPHDTIAWEALIRRGREAGLLGTLAWRLSERGLLDAVPAAPRAHLRAALVVCRAQEAAVHREVREIVRALRGIGAPIVLLKGAAYLLAELPPAQGRVFSDVDILVPKGALPDVESALMLAGFATTHHHPYDQRYYRRWMHELPPMQHVKRLTVLDVHHTIVPATGRVRLDASNLFRASVALTQHAELQVLAPADMVLHSATHLFQNEDLTHGLRDLVDIHALLTHFGARPRFFAELASRAEELDVMRPLFYALRFASRLFDMDVPREVVDAVSRHGPRPPLSRAMDMLLGAALMPDAARASTRLARQALYVRGHWLRMPVPLLAWHLTVKAFRREEGQPA